MFDHLSTLKEYIRCQSVSTDPSFAPGMKRARDCIGAALADLGLSVEIVPTDGEPVVLAQRAGDESWPHVIIYGHYDVQPADPVDLWTSQPFEPEVRGNRIYGRGAADNKGPFLVHVAALAGLLEERPDLPLRVTLIVEGEEEIGSPSFDGFLQQRQNELRGDLVLVSDTASPSANQIVITCGLRGIVTMEVEVEGPRSDLHSGVHGGAVFNPVQALAGILASLHTPDGRVAIDGFYDAVRPVEDWERDELRKLGSNEDDYRKFLGVERFHTPPGFSPFEAVRFQPSLEINGIGGGYQGKGSKTIIPARAFAKLSCRLVADQEPAEIAALLEKTLIERCPPAVAIRVRRGHSGRPYLVVPPRRPNTPPDQPKLLESAFDAADEGVREAFGSPPLYLREGGSIPIIADIKTVLSMDSVLLGLFLPEDNLHAPNESFDLAVMEKGIRVSRHILSRLAVGT